MRVRVLGTGGFLNSGLRGNAFLVDGRLLVETPPDIVASLGAAGARAGAIEELFISHAHGDHVFGAPFLLFNAWKERGGGKGPRIVAARATRERILELAALAIRPGHPYVAWIRDECESVEAAPGTGFSFGPYEAECYPMFHELPTLGLGLRERGGLLFQYLPDTRWDERVGAYLSLGARLAVCDLNGTGGDRSVHMGAEDLEERLDELVPAGTRLLGTHLSGPMEARRGRVEFAREGMTFRIAADGVVGADMAAPLPDGALIREALVADAELIARQRAAMFVDMGSKDLEDVERMRVAAEREIARGLKDGSYRAWLAEAGGEVVAGGGVIVAPFQPTPTDPALRRAWIVNVYVAPEWRARGFAHALMRVMVAWCREQGFGAVSLHASEAGRPIYEELGFSRTNEMRLALG
ncbi:MAG: GNAT family N-acetyltransferase [Spirochaetales bacterium]|nr:GNAT family N-acetyltransferase [Spirochaetales bacterium]